MCFDMQGISMCKDQWVESWGMHKVTDISTPPILTTILSVTDCWENSQDHLSARTQA